MSYSRYITSGTTTGGGGLVHTVSNSGNSTFDWLSPDHMKIYLSTAGQSQVDFTAAIAAGTVNEFTPQMGYTLVGVTLTFSGLNALSSYFFQVKRVTPKLSHFVDFSAGSPLTEVDLDNSNKYALFRSQELEDDLETVNAVASSSTFTLTLAAMKAVASVTGDFVGHSDTQNIENKTFAANKGNTYDCGGRSWT